jgi:hypothetical protein
MKASRLEEFSTANSLIFPVSTLRTCRAGMASRSVNGAARPSADLPCNGGSLKIKIWSPMKPIAKGTVE